MNKAKFDVRVQFCVSAHPNFRWYFDCGDGSRKRSRHATSEIAAEPFMTDAIDNLRPHAPTTESRTDETPCYILALPVEILSEILRSVVEAESPEWVARVQSVILFEPSRTPPSPVIILRAVCRQFRETIDHLQFWYQDNFDPLDLLPD